MTSADEARDHALAWLTGRLHWERLLTDLHRRADELGEPVALATTIDAIQPATAQPPSTPAPAKAA